jgi:hypothetical protein
MDTEVITVTEDHDKSQPAGCLLEIHKNLIKKCLFFFQIIIAVKRKTTGIFLCELSDSV